MQIERFSLFVTFLILFANWTSAERISKKIYKNYPITSVQKLDINNKYGNIYIENNRSDSVIVSVDIWVEGDNDKGKQLLNSINVSVDLNGSTILANTLIENMTNQNNEFSIDYRISIPQDRELAIVQKYGNVNLKDLTGKGHFDIKYGELNGQKLLSPDLSMDIAYSKVNIESINDLNMTLYYSKFRLRNGNRIKLESRYSVENIDECKIIDADSKYDNFYINNINTVIMNSLYTTTAIETLSSKLNLTNGYGGFTIKQIPSGFDNIVVENKYAVIKLGIATNASYKIYGKTRYCTIAHPDGKLSKLSESTNYEVNGTIGNSDNIKSAVRITSNFGDVNLNPQ